MPLALLAIGSVVDRQQFEVVILDARVDSDADQRIEELLPNAICFGISVITGNPINDALRVSKNVKKIAPKLPVIWGGWHTSVFPTEPLMNHECIDITVQGQGEETFNELINHLSAGLSLEHIKGIAYRDGVEIRHNESRQQRPMMNFGSIDYSLIAVEKYFVKKGWRQFDYVSSTGCNFRCAFCADPFVHKRKYTALSADRMIDELASYYKQYQFTDLNFQDENLFTDSSRVLQFASSKSAHKLSFSWAATLRADQGARLKDAEWAVLKGSGLRRLLIGVESGSQQMLDWLKKDIFIEQVHYCAEQCKTHGIAAIFPFIVGFPDETEDSVNETMKQIKLLNKMSPDFETPIFYYNPYPGSSIVEELQGHSPLIPQTTQAWSKFGFESASGPWLSQEKLKKTEKFKFYLKVAYSKKSLWPLNLLAGHRIEHDWYGFPIEKFIYNLLKPQTGNS